MSVHGLIDASQFLVCFTDAKAVICDHIFGLLVNKDSIIDMLRVIFA